MFGQQKIGERLFSPSVRTRLHEHLLKNAKENSILIEALNVQPEHVHLLVNLSRTSAIEEVGEVTQRRIVALDQS